MSPDTGGQLQAGQKQDLRSQEFPHLENGGHGPHLVGPRSGAKEAELEKPFTQGSAAHVLWAQAKPLPLWALGQAGQPREDPAGFICV